jgi:flagellar M-ring protein FliF
VSGLSADRVAIVDDRGNLLAGGDDKSGPDALARSQDEDTSNYENSLRARIEAIVSSVVGMGRVQVQVAADINYNHTQTTSETYDPDSKVVRSTQTVEQNAVNSSGSTSAAVSVASALPGGQAAPAGGGDQSKDTSGRTEETTNYEISKKVTTSTVDGGDIKKVSVAVVVDGSGDTAAAYKPRSADEMAKITALVKSAMGFDSARGDLVQVTNMQFAHMEQSAGTEAPKPLLGLDSSYWFKIIEAAIMCVTALLIGLFVAKPLINSMFSAQTASGTGPTVLANGSVVAGALPAPAGADQPASAGQEGAPALPPPKSSIDISRIDGQVRESSIKKVGEVVSAHPEEALAIIRTWLHQPV